MRAAGLGGGGRWRDELDDALVERLAAHAGGEGAQKVVEVLCDLTCGEVQRDVGDNALVADQESLQSADQEVEVHQLGVLCACTDVAPMRWWPRIRESGVADNQSLLKLKGS